MRDGRADLDIREIGLDHTVHYTPDIRDRIFMRKSDVQLLSDKGPCALASKEVLCEHSLLFRSVDVFQFNLDGIFICLGAARLEARDCPRPLDLGAVLLKISDKGPLDVTLV